MSLSTARLLANRQCLEMEQKFKAPVALRFREFAKSNY